MSTATQTAGKDPQQAPELTDETIVALVLEGKTEEAKFLEGASMRRHQRQREAAKEEARIKYIAALHTFQSQIGPVHKGATAGGGGMSYKYATIAHYLQDIQPALTKAGLTVHWVPKVAEGALQITCVTTHTAGHSEQVSMHCPMADMRGGNAAQKLGALMTYLERYTLIAALGLSSEDTDAGGAGQGTQRTRDKAPPRQPAAAQAGQLPPYPEDRLQKNLPIWKETVVKGEKTPAAIIKACSRDYMLSNGQRDIINRLGAVAPDAKAQQDVTS